MSSLKPRIPLSAGTVSLSAQSLLREPVHKNHAPSADVLATYRTRRTSRNARDRGGPARYVRALAIGSCRALGIAPAKRFLTSCVCENASGDSVRVRTDLIFEDPCGQTHDLRRHNVHPFPLPPSASSPFSRLHLGPSLLARLSPCLTSPLLSPSPGSLWCPGPVWCFRATWAAPGLELASTMIVPCRRPGFLPAGCENARTAAAHPHDHLDAELRKPGNNGRDGSPRRRRLAHQQPR